MSDSARLRVGISAEQAVSVGIDPAFYRGDPAIPNLHIGTVEAGQDAEDLGVSVTGEYPDYYLNFVLPRGSVGATPEISIGAVQSASTAEATITGTPEAPVLNLKLPIAPAPVLSIGSVGEGQEPAVTMTGTAANPVLNFQLVRGPQGRGVASFQRTAGTGAPGTTDTYTIAYTDGTSDTFTVRNGANGEGAGDMVAHVYDEDGDGIVERADVADALDAGASIAMEQVQGLSDALAGLAVEETDPTVPAWAKQPSKPAYTADEVGAKDIGWVPEMGDVTGLTQALEGKAALSHQHQISDVDQLEQQLAGKAAADHVHTEDAIVNLDE